MKLDKIDYEKIGDELQINAASVNDSFLNQAQLCNHYGMQSVAARAGVERAKLNLSIVESEVDQAVRLKADSQNEKMTEGKVTSRVQLTPEWQAAKSQVIEADSIYRVLNQTVESFGQRRDMLVQISKHMLVEREGELRMSSSEVLGSAKDKANAALAGK